MLKYLMISSLLCTNMLRSQGFEVPAEKMYVPERLGAIKLVHNNVSFVVQQNGESHTVESYALSTELRNIDNAKLKKLLDCGYIAVGQYSDGAFKLKFNARSLSYRSCYGNEVHYFTSNDPALYEALH